MIVLLTAPLWGGQNARETRRSAGGTEARPLLTQCRESAGSMTSFTPHETP